MTKSREKTFYIDDGSDSKNVSKLYEEICSEINKSDNAKHKRKIAVDLLQKTIDSNFANLKINFENHQLHVNLVTKGLTKVTDVVIQTIFMFSTQPFTSTYHSHRSRTSICSCGWWVWKRGNGPFFRCRFIIFNTL